MSKSNTCDVCGEFCAEIYINLYHNKSGHKNCVKYLGENEELQSCMTYREGEGKDALFTRNYKILEGWAKDNILPVKSDEVEKSPINDAFLLIIKQRVVDGNKRYTFKIPFEKLPKEFRTQSYLSTTIYKKYQEWEKESNEQETRPEL